jgi:hypothetical protein
MMSYEYLICATMAIIAHYYFSHDYEFHTTCWTGTKSYIPYEFEDMCHIPICKSYMDDMDEIELYNKIKVLNSDWDNIKTYYDYYTFFTKDYNISLPDKYDISYEIPRDVKHIFNTKELNDLASSSS